MTEKRSEQKGLVLECEQCDYVAGPLKLRQHTEKHFTKPKSRLKQVANICPRCRLYFEDNERRSHYLKHHPMMAFKAISRTDELSEISDPSSIEASPDASRLVYCIKCQNMQGIFQGYIDKHFKNFHDDVSFAPDSIDRMRLSFEILPPGCATYRQAFDYYRERHPSNRFFAQVFDWDRLTQIESLGLRVSYWGKKGFYGYGVFECDYSSKVVLECPVEGNAIYVLTGNWENMICLTKADLRQEYNDHCTVVVHKGDWLARLESLLFGDVRPSAQRFNL